MNSSTFKPKRAKPKSKVMPVFSGSDVSTVHQSRCAVFQPTRRPIYQTRVQKNEWGSTTTKGRLGQSHQDTLDACFCVAEKHIVASDGRIFLQIDPYKLRRKLGNLPHSKIEEWLQELRSATVEIRVPTRGIWALGGIIDEAVESDKGIPESGHRGAIYGGERKYLRVVISRIWAGMMKQDLPTGYRGRFDNILALKSGVSQAIARLMLTHAASARIGMDAALLAIGAETGHCHRARLIRSMEADLPLLLLMGITVTDNVVSVSLTTPTTPHVPGESNTPRPTFPETRPTFPDFLGSL